jgi:hypothetical protein
VDWPACASIARSTAPASATEEGVAPMNDAARKSDMWSTWLERWAWLSLPGDALAVVLWDLPTLFAATLCSGVLAATFLVYRQARAWQPTEGSGSQLIRSVVRSTPRMTLVCLSTMALMTLSPSAGLGVIGLLTVTSPALHRCIAGSWP